MAFCFSVPQLCSVCNFEQVFPSAVSFSFFLVVVLFAAYTFGMYGVLILSCPAPMSGISLYFLAHGFIFHPFSYYFSGGVVQVLIHFFFATKSPETRDRSCLDWSGALEAIIYYGEITLLEFCSNVVVI